MVTISTKIPDSLNSSFLAYAKRHGLPQKNLVATAIRRLLEAENNTIHVFESDDEIREFTTAVNARTMAKLN